MTNAPDISPIVQLCAYLTGRFQALETSMELLADAVEANPAKPSEETLSLVVQRLNHEGLHVMDWQLVALSLGVPLN